MSTPITTLSQTAVYSYAGHTFTFSPDLLTFFVIRNDTGVSTAYSVDGLTIKLVPDSNELQLLPLNTNLPTVFTRFFLSLDKDFTSLLIDTRPIPETSALRNVFRAGGIGVTDLLDIDPVTLDYHTLDFAGTYNFDGSPNATIECIKLELTTRTNRSATFSNSKFDYSESIAMPVLAGTIYLNLP